MEEEKKKPERDPSEKRALHYPASAMPCGYSAWEIQELWTSGAVIPFRGDKAPYVIVTHPTKGKRRESVPCVKVEEGK